MRTPLRCLFLAFRGLSERELSPIHGTNFGCYPYPRRGGVAVESGGIMQQVCFEYNVNITFTITGRELLRLKDLSQRHYDDKCRAAGQHGGFLFGFINQWLYSDGVAYGPSDHPNMSREVEITATAHELGVLCKIGEVELFAGFDGEVFGFTHKFTKMQQNRANEERDLYSRVFSNVRAATNS